METKWTPGPWRISGAAEGAGITIEAKRNSLIAFVRDNQHPLTDVQEHEATANAKLISKAPELVDALRSLAHQVKISNAIDDHGHDLKNLQALHEAERVLREAGALD